MKNSHSFFKKFIFFLSFILLFLPSFCVFFMPHEEIMQTENRKIRSFPEFSLKNIRDVYHFKDYFKNIELWYNDRFPLRDISYTFTSYFNKFNLFETDLNKKCLEGNKDWLFLGNPYQKTIDILEGYFTPDENDVASNLKFFQTVEKVAKSYNADFFIFIGPNKSTIYPEYLPSSVIPAKNRCTDLFIDSIQKNRIKIFDPTELLLSHKKYGLLYYRTDTHWNNLGSYYAFKEFCHFAGFPVIKEVSFLTGSYYKGDLVKIGGFSNFPIHLGDNFIINNDNYNPLINKNVLILGDSFSEALFPYFKKLFTNVTRIHYNSVINSEKEDKKMKSYISKLNQKPDIIIWVQVERYFNYSYTAHKNWTELVKNIIKK